MKIGVCIPCHFLYVKFLDRLFLSIDKKTYKPLSENSFIFVKSECLHLKCNDFDIHGS